MYGPQSASAITPADDFRLTVDTSRPCKAYGTFTTGADYSVVHNEVLDADINVPDDIDWKPLRTQTAITPAAGKSIIYLY